MKHRRFEFVMPARTDVVFDTFHYHCWRSRWDSLVSNTQVSGGAPCPYVGAITENVGGGWLKALSMKTSFITYKRPKIAAARMIGEAFPFTKWAASMKHQPVDENRSVMIYTYNFEVGPRYLRYFLEPIVKLIFDRQTVRRFNRMKNFLREHGDEVIAWQLAERVISSTSLARLD